MRQVKHFGVGWARLEWKGVEREGVGRFYSAGSEQSCRHPPSLLGRDCSSERAARADADGARAGRARGLRSLCREFELGTRKEERERGQPLRARTQGRAGKRGATAGRTFWPRRTLVK